MESGATTSTGNDSKGKRSRNFCCAFGCSNTPAKDSKLSFHTFPSEEKHLDRRNKWIDAVKRKDWMPSKYSVLCSDHFTIDSYRRPPGMQMAAILKPTAVPRVFDSLPKYLQPTQPKHRRLLCRPTPSPPDRDELVLEPPLWYEEPTVAKQSVETIPDPLHKRTRGRPKIAPEIRIPNLLKKVNTLNHKLQRLQNTTSI
ncbi:THAP domain-containing protein 1-like [Watersipora subatra]|uniref:THAP domain-containing protein 1-like n=1 Tax=Watersipora subatra TaxID=2589382 RepID=UPI00355C35F8